MPTTECSLRERYAALRDRAFGLPRDEAIQQYEVLCAEARAREDTSLLARCLSDLAALTAPIDRATARSLLDAALLVDGEDPTLLENLAQIVAGDGDFVLAAHHALQAAELYRDLGAAECAAAAVDAVDRWRQRGVPLEEPRWRAVAEWVVRSASPGEDSVGRSVLLIGDLVHDRELLRARIDHCREHDEEPVLLRVQRLASETPSSWDRSLRWLDVDVSDLRELPAAVANSSVVGALSRCELLSSTDRFLGWLAACASGTVVRMPDVGHGGIDWEGAAPCANLHGPAEDVSIVRLERGGPSSRATVEAWNRAARAARGQVLVFVDADTGTPDEELLAAHRELLTGDRPRCVVAGLAAPEIEPSITTAMVRQQGLFRVELDGEGPLRLVLPRHFSVRKECFETLGGFEAAAGPHWCLSRFLDRLRAAGGEVHPSTDLCVLDRRRLDAETLVSMARSIGRDWAELALEVGEQQPRLFESAVELDVSFATELLTAFLAEEDRAVRFLATLRASERRIDDLLADRKVRREEVSSAVGGDFRGLVDALFVHEVQRGVLQVLGGADDIALPGSGWTVVWACPDESVLGKLRRVLGSMPDDAELAVIAPDSLAALLPGDPRLVRWRPEEVRSPAGMRRKLGTTRGDFVAFLDGSVSPSVEDWRALALFLRSLSMVGAVALSPMRSHDMARAQAASDLPTAVVATRRNVLDEDPGGEGNFLTRLRDRGGILLEVRAPAASSAPVAAQADAEH